MLVAHVARRKKWRGDYNQAEQHRIKEMSSNLEKSSYRVRRGPWGRRMEKSSGAQMSICRRRELVFEVIRKDVGACGVRFGWRLVRSDC